ncbi:hypothetical protein KAR91_31300 [Candidatus Pacearchaeota archaeon]|nr:hypothetical protein [Candidatus Pacearchaeota archaeon]
MPRDVSKSTQNRMGIADSISDDTIVWLYRLPSTEERILYRKQQTQIKGQKVKIKTTEVQLKFGKKIITGFEKSVKNAEGELEGGFVKDDVPFSSDKKDKDYREDWMDLVEETSSDLIIQLAAIVFDGTGKASDDDEDEGEDKEPVPLQKEEILPGT